MYTPFFLIGITMSIIQVLKKADILSYDHTRFLPVLSLVLGTVIGLCAGTDFVTGLMIGAASSGTYDVVSKSVLDN